MPKAVQDEYLATDPLTVSITLKLFVENTLNIRKELQPVVTGPDGRFHDFIEKMANKVVYSIVQ
jgi:hypothetical protein